MQFTVLYFGLVGVGHLFGDADVEICTSVLPLGELVDLRLSDRGDCDHLRAGSITLQVGDDTVVEVGVEIAVEVKKLAPLLQIAGDEPGHGSILDSLSLGQPTCVAAVSKHGHHADSSLTLLVVIYEGYGERS